MVDSEAPVKVPGLGSVPCDSESLTQIAAKLSIVAANRDTVLSDYVRFKIREWVEQLGREQKDLAAVAGFKSPSTVAMVKRGQGVGAASAPGFASAFGYSSVQAMVDAAYEWRRGLGESLERRLADESFRKAAEMLGAFMPMPSDAELRTIAADFVGARFDGRDPEWWLRTLSDELKRDRERDRLRANERRTEQADRKREIRTEEGRWRADARRKHDVAAATADLLKRERAAETDVSKMRKRRKIRAV